MMLSQNHGKRRCQCRVDAEWMPAEKLPGCSDVRWAASTIWPPHRRSDSATPKQRVPSPEESKAPIIRQSRIIRLDRQKSFNSLAPAYQWKPEFRGAMAGSCNSLVAGRWQQNAWQMTGRKEAMPQESGRPWRSGGRPWRSREERPRPSSRRKRQGGK
ncbi:unnamed protein product [Calypogeia fissa]